MGKIEVNDYIEGYEYYGRTKRKVKGWVDKITTGMHGEILYQVQCDDSYNGYRGNYIHDCFGVVKLAPIPRPVLTR